jgi:hypothetical protein
MSDGLSREVWWNHHRSLEFFTSQSATLIDRTSHRHRAPDFDAGIGPGNIDKSRAIRTARLHMRARIQLGCGRRPRRHRRVWIGKRLRTSVSADRDGEHGGRRYRGGAAERQAVSHSGTFYYFSEISATFDTRPPISFTIRRQDSRLRRGSACANSCAFEVWQRATLIVAPGRNAVPQSS